MQQACVAWSPNVPFLQIFFTNPRCSSLSNNVNLQWSRYARLKLNIGKLKYEKWSKYRFNPQKRRVMGNPKKPEKSQE